MVKQVTAASFTIVMLTDLTGDEIWTEEAGGAWAIGKCGIFWWTTQNLVVKTARNKNLCEQNLHSEVKCNHQFGIGV